jgi:magnesium chelatase subunit I
MVFEGEQQGAEIVAKKLIGEAVKALFEARFPPVEGPKGRAEKSRKARNDFDEDDPQVASFDRSERRSTPPPPTPYDRIVSGFSKEKKVVLSDETPFATHLASLKSVEGLEEFVKKHTTPKDEYDLAFLMELVLEGLVLNLRIAREDLDSTVSYSEMAKFNLMRSRG